jgi:hypothetical protein
MRVTNLKTCYCYRCNEAFHYLGIDRHRQKHKENKEDCMIMYTDGRIFSYRYDTNKVKEII